MKGFSMAVLEETKDSIGLPDVFRSKRFWTAVFGLAFMVLVEFVPALASSSDMLQQSALALVGLLIGGYHVQDAVVATKQGASKYQPLLALPATEKNVAKG